MPMNISLTNILRYTMTQEYLQIVVAAISFRLNGSIGQFGKIGSKRLLANVNDMIAFVLGLKKKILLTS